MSDELKVIEFTPKERTMVDVMGEITTAINGLNDKNAAIERLENMVEECRK